MTIYNSQGYEVGNVLDKLTYPAPRLKRTGPAPAPSQQGPDPLPSRGSPIRVRPFAFGVRSGGLRSLVASGPYSGPGLIKRLDVTFFLSPNGTPQPFFNIFYDTSPYVTAHSTPLANIPHGNAVWASGIADDQPTTFVDEGGLTSSGVTSGGTQFVINQYVADSQFYVGLSIRNQVGSAFSVYGSLLVYEGVLPSDYPGVLA